uniref:Uncharacterized protein n=1 Tax=Anguilla anguilla TaxID=7936 RepID=A0A0E9PX52_ANGAN
MLNHSTRIESPSSVTPLCKSCTNGCSSGPKNRKHYK